MVDGETREMLFYTFICESYSSGKNEAITINPIRVFQQLYGLVRADSTYLIHG
jgi:hypothetical protein